MPEILSPLKAASALEASLFFLVVNGVIFLGSVALCRALGRVFRKRQIFDRWEPVRPVELAAALGAVVLNAGVSVIGWWLWTRDVIVLKDAGFLRSAADCLLMILAMDLGMYTFHRLAHVPWIYHWIHRFHHRHKVTNPISLFVLHPVEVAGFGGLMIVFLWLYPMAAAGLVGYLTLNVLFGTLGHSGVEPFPSVLWRVPVLRLLGTSTFHAEHHEHPQYNFGFYTLVWDRLFGTLDPDYHTRVCRACGGAALPDLPGRGIGEGRRGGS